MSDLFHPDVPAEFIHDIWNVMSNTPRHTYIILTKRPYRMHMLLPYYFKTLPNVWLGVTVENQKAADERIPLLLQTPAAKRFVSIEPMLGPIALHLMEYGDAADRQFPGGTCLTTRRRAIDLVIVGGESGPKARPMHPDWVRSIRDQCKAAGVPFMFKQWGEWLPGKNGPQDVIWQNGTFGFRGVPKNELNYVMWEPGGTAHFGRRTPANPFEVDCFAERVGKKRAGCLLDDVMHNEYPDQRQAA
jgi:hypothetical protein